MENQSEIILDHLNMGEYFRQTKEFIFLDRIQVLPGVSANGEKTVSEQEWYFKYHFPNMPVMPGVFQMEAIMQSGGLIINTLEGKKELTLMFGECKSVRINASVRPGDVLRTSVILKNYKRGIAWFEGTVSVDDKVTCRMTFSLIAPDEVSAIFQKGMETSE